MVYFGGIFVEMLSDPKIILTVIGFLITLFKIEITSFYISHAICFIQEMLNIYNASLAIIAFLTLFFSISPIVILSYPILKDSIEIIEDKLWICKTCKPMREYIWTEQIYKDSYYSCKEIRTIDLERIRSLVEKYFKDFKVVFELTPRETLDKRCDKHIVLDFKISKHKQLIKIIISEQNLITQIKTGVSEKDILNTMEKEIEWHITKSKSRTILALFSIIPIVVLNILASVLQSIDCILSQIIWIMVSLYILSIYFKSGAMKISNPFKKQFNLNKKKAKTYFIDLLYRLIIYILILSLTFLIPFGVQITAIEFGEQIMLNFIANQLISTVIFTTVILVLIYFRNFPSGK